MAALRKASMHVSSHSLHVGGMPASPWLVPVTTVYVVSGAIGEGSLGGQPLTQSSAHWEHHTAYVGVLCHGCAVMRVSYTVHVLHVSQSGIRLFAETRLPDPVGLDCVVA